MRAYSRRKRWALLAACDGGAGTKAVAQQFHVSESWVRRLKQRRRQPRISLRSDIRNRVPRWAEYREQINALMKANPKMTLRELKESLGTELSIQTLSRALQDMNWSKRMPRAWREGEHETR